MFRLESFRMSLLHLFPRFTEILNRQTVIAVKIVYFLQFVLLTVFSDIVINIECGFYTCMTDAFLHNFRFHACVDAVRDKSMAQHMLIGICYTDLLTNPFESRIHFTCPYRFVGSVGHKKQIHRIAFDNFRSNMV